MRHVARHDVFPLINYPIIFAQVIRQFDGSEYARDIVTYMTTRPLLDEDLFVNTIVDKLRASMSCPYDRAGFARQIARLCSEDMQGATRPTNHREFLHAACARLR